MKLVFFFLATGLYEKYKPATDQTDYKISLTGSYTLMYAKILPEDCFTIDYMPYMYTFMLSFTHTHTHTHHIHYTPVHFLLVTCTDPSFHFCVSN